MAGKKPPSRFVSQHTHTHLARRVQTEPPLETRHLERGFGF